MGGGEIINTFRLTDDTITGIKNVELQKLSVSFQSMIAYKWKSTSISTMMILLQRD